MIKSLYSIFTVLSVITVIVVESSNPNAPTFTVGVVEFAHDVKSLSPNEKMKNNLIGYKNLLKQYLDSNTIGKDVDLVIFPEMTLNSIETAIFIPDVDKNSVKTLCQMNNPDLLETLACWAGQFGRYIAYNVVEKEYCTEESQNAAKDDRPCATNGLSLYNTNIVLNRKGVLVAKYRKWNLYQEYMKNTTRTPELVTFDSDFGIKFGTFICFDILFWTPPQDLIKMGVKYFIYPTMWFSELPFFTANQVQQAWAFANNATLLVSGASNPTVGSTGTGVFDGRNGGPYSEMQSVPMNKMFIIKIDKDHNVATIDRQQRQNTISKYPVRLTGLHLKRDKAVDKYANSLIDSKELDVSKKLCHNNFCCDFKIKRVSFNNTQMENFYSYRMIVYAGQRKWEDYRELWYKTCAIIACTDDHSLTSCGKIFNDDVVYLNSHYFEHIEISGDFGIQEKLLIMPSTVDTNISPLSVEKFDLSSADIGSKRKVVMSLKAPEANLLTFGIHANYYDGFNSASSMSFEYLKLLIVGLVSLLVFQKFRISI